jgi:hypothetical protein
MKHSLFLLLLLVVLVGCPSHEDPTYRVYYHGNGATSGNVPVDSREYLTGNTATVRGQENLKNGDFTLLGWRDYDKLYSPGDYITINRSDINLYASWDDGNDTPFSFDIVDGEAIITRFNERYSSSITIPTTLQSKPVTAIDDNVFSNYSISSVYLPRGLKRIGIGAFASNSISQITIPDSVELIRVMAFQNNNLRRITLGSGLRTIEPYTFRNNLLVEITIPETISSIGAGAFQGNTIEMVKIGAGVTIGSATSLGTYGASFLTCYTGDPRAGLYLYIDNDTWERL